MRIAFSEDSPWRSAPPGELHLGRKDVHVWRAWLDVSASYVKSFRELLSIEEVSQAERFYLICNRHRYVVARGLLRTILGRYLRIEPERLLFGYNDHGKPFLAFPGDIQRVSFNLAHSSGMALFAFAYPDRRIGIDLEKIRTVASLDLISRRFFPPDDCAALEIMPEPLKSQSFFRSWTQMEAYGKALGTGLTTALKDGKISLHDQTLSQGRECLDKSVWSMHCWHPAPEYVAALAVEGNDWHLKYWGV
jgi:4'-phosphopantetheinyl transferase